MRVIYLTALLALGLALSLPDHAVAQSKFFSFERNIDRPGSDFRNTESPGANDCSFACQMENQCRAWTFVRPGVQGPSGRCFLKNSVPQARGDSCCTSGARKGSTTIDRR
jgi:PAN domain